MFVDRNVLLLDRPELCDYEGEKNKKIYIYVYQLCIVTTDICLRNTLFDRPTEIIRVSFNRGKKRKEKGKKVENLRGKITRGARYSRYRETILRIIKFIINSDGETFR